ncbi:MAG TPA: DHHA1 domain-containing protein, partial [Candidatus Saccharimonadia bacterium]|nr:DHHA1 domain-containing protein [Candidatus Saccharimonadia bacterium]
QKKLERELESLRAKAAGSVLDDAIARAEHVGGIMVLAARVGAIDSKALRASLDQAKQRLKDCVVVLASANEGKAALVAGAGGAALARVDAGELLSHVAAQIGGRGGGRPDMAQGGGDDSPKLDEALALVAPWVRARLAG